MMARALRRTALTEAVGDPMRLAARHRNLIATIIVIAVALVALTVLCADGVHGPLAGSISEACAAMTHSAGLGEGSVADVASASASTLAVAIAGFVLVFGATFARPVSSHTGASLAPTANPLNGRLLL
jgi:hypothetical protein